MMLAVSMARGRTLAEQHVGPHPAGGGEVVPQRLGLLAAERRQPGAAGRAGDRTVEAGVGLTVAYQDQSHGPPR